ncbi:hypothetical protein [Sulfitobacter sp. R18_1]|uniref:hypothetical protein n=1 Tax=Sulfitobacter sp. R18_1 TaxID=2821104 RepID=UPI001ADA422A|nr:hypothetical protein [Sulfitobacter sp. R18_1]MBO9428044.1 hypothetical protein [Sulfitobacter sp. R18_1]
MRSYLVGGAVRDTLMDITPKDHDFVVVGSTPEEMLSRGFEQVGADFPVFLHPKTKDEYALARREKKTGSGYTGFTCEFGTDVTLAEDLRRRDLTINAMAMYDDGSICDPFGGQRDIENGLLRHVDATSFVEDPVRVLRLARFAARYPRFKISPQTVDLIYQMGRAGTLNELTSERVYGELSRALMEQTPSRFFDTLLECDVLHILFPEVYGLLSATEWKRHHPEGNAYDHTMLVLEEMRASEDCDLCDMFNALCHDFGKAATPKDMLPRHPGHEEYGLPIIEGFLGRLKAPSDITKYALRTTRYHMLMHRFIDLKEISPKGVCKMFDASLHGAPEFVSRLMRLAKADERGRQGCAANNVDHLHGLERLHDAYTSPTFAEVIGDRKLSGSVIKTEMQRARNLAVKQAFSELKRELQNKSDTEDYDQGMKL